MQSADNNLVVGQVSHESHRSIHWRVHCWSQKKPKILPADVNTRRHLFRLHVEHARCEDYQKLCRRQSRKSMHELLLQADVVRFMFGKMVCKSTASKRERNMAEKSSILSYVPSNILHFRCLPSKWCAIKDKDKSYKLFLTCFYSLNFMLNSESHLDQNNNFKIWKTGRNWRNSLNDFNADEVIHFDGNFKYRLEGNT